MMKNSEYTQRLENVIKQMLKPLKDVPFNLVIEALSGRKVIRFNDKEPEHEETLDVLKQVAKKASVLINKEGISRNRPNEVGNDIETFVKKSFTDLKIKKDTPSTTKNRKKATGYPDIIFWVKNKPYYLECKTFNKKNLNTTQRSFYLSPSDEFKVIYDTIHFCLSFEMERKTKRNKSVFICKSFKILSLEELSMDLKFEFNSDNKRLYSNLDGAKILYEENLI